jgi:predicted RNA-binding Zn-ribbon protein involved in translation (DUF1610 family)
VRNRYPKKSLPKNSLTKNKKIAETYKTWYFVCPSCGKATIVVTEFEAVPCGGRWCRGLVDLKANQITEDEYNRKWGI